MLVKNTVPLHIVIKVYERIMMNHVKIINESLVSTGQDGFRKGRWCVSQVFVLIQWKSIREKEMCIQHLWTLKRHMIKGKLWKVSTLYILHGKQMNAAKNFYSDSGEYIKVVV